VMTCINHSSACTPQQRQTADLNKDGSVGQDDLGLIQGSFGTLGDSFAPPQFECVTDPSCANTGNGTIQLCALKCSIKNPTP